MRFTETKEFTDNALSLLGEEGILELQIHLMEHPEAGDLIPKSGGARKLRWAAKGKGKRGGSRVIYVYYKLEQLIDLLTIYAKNKQENISPNEIKRLKGE